MSVVWETLLHVNRTFQMSSWGWGLAGLFTAALLFRVAYLIQVALHPILADALMLDAAVFDALAQRILQGDLSLGDRAFTLAPLYPYWLAVARLCFGESNLAIYGLQQMLGLASIALAARLAYRLAGPFAATVTTAMLTLYAPLAFMETKLMASSLAVFLSIATLVVMIHANDRGWRRRFVWAGCLLGLTCLARPNTLLFCPLAFGWLLWTASGQEASRKELRRPLASQILPAAALTLGVLIVILPVSLRNTLKEGEFILISSQAGPTFLQGNNAGATGGYTVMPEFTGDPDRQAEEAITLASAALGRPATRSEANSYLIGQGVSFYREHPGPGALLLLKKLRHWIGNQELSTEYVLATERRMTPLLWLLPLPFGLIFACSLLALGRADRWDPAEHLLWAFVLANGTAVLIFYFSSRYRLPAVSIVAILAGIGASSVRDTLRGHLTPSLLAAGAALGVLAAAGIPHDDGLAIQDAANRFNLGVLYQEAGQFEAARDEYLASLETHESRWDTHHNLGLAYLRLGKPREAIEHLERALVLNPKSAGSRQTRDAIQERLDIFHAGTRATPEE